MDELQQDHRTLLLVLVAGISVHVLYFHRFEFHRRLYAIIVAFIIANVYLFADSAKGNDLIDAAIWAFKVDVSFLLGALCSTFTFRLLLNPLNCLPGPFAARLTNFWMAFHVGGRLNQYRKLELLHKKYGRIVRTGAKSLSIVSSKFVEPTLGLNSLALKGEWYDIDYPYTNLHGERDRKTHQKRRQTWAYAFSDKALNGYQPVLRAHSDKLLARIKEGYEGRPIDVAKWFTLWSFDVMGALAFGKEYGMLGRGEMHEIFDILQDSVSILGLSLPAWSIRLLKLIPGDGSGMKRFHAFTDAEFEDAMRAIHLDGRETSMVSTLFKGYEDEGIKVDEGALRADTRLVIVAGSGTTTTALTFAFYLLAQHPLTVAAIRVELRARLRWKAALNDYDLRECELLNGAIMETLRLFPPGPTGIYRETPPEGMIVDGTWIPGRTTINIPPFLLARDESVYEHAQRFVPERWYGRSETVKSSAFITFGRGPFGCIGKALALMEMRTVIADLLLAYDVKFAPGEDGSRLLNDSKDHFSMTVAPLDLVFTPV